MPLQTPPVKSATVVLGSTFWLSGGREAHDNRDVVVQEFSGSPGFDSPVIIWTAQIPGTRAIVIGGPAWQTYLAHGGPDGWLGYPTGNQRMGPQGYLIFEFENGFVETKDGRTYTAMPTVTPFPTPTAVPTPTPTPTVA